MKAKKLFPDKSIKRLWNKLNKVDEDVKDISNVVNSLEIIPIIEHGLIEASTTGVGTVTFTKTFTNIPNVMLQVFDPNSVNATFSAVTTDITATGFSYKLMYTSGSTTGIATVQKIYWTAIS